GKVFVGWEDISGKRVENSTEVTGEWYVYPVFEDEQVAPVTYKVHFYDTDETTEITAVNGAEGYTFGTYAEGIAPSY
ncbi:hypothetical protein H6A23_11320, partial [Olsenella uli]|uniref:hypothetical protein n=1 Tax=Olsenella uli TaxID=133926 RepID=UPI0019589048